MAGRRSAFQGGLKTTVAGGESRVAKGKSGFWVFDTGFSQLESVWFAPNAVSLHRNGETMTQQPLLIVGGGMAGALLALRALGDADGASRRAALSGARWLRSLQNRDGGIPTFCRGWGQLPFDQSTSDLTAHALRASLAK